MKIQRLFFFALLSALFTLSATAQTCSNTFGVLFGNGAPAANQCTSSTNSLIYVDTSGTLGEFFCQCSNGVGTWIQSNSPGLPSIPPTVMCSPASLIFPATNTNQSSAVQNVSCVNNSQNGAAVVFSGITLTTGTNFSQTNNCGTLNAGDSCIIGITFAPTTTGALVDTLSIASNAAGSPDTVALAGTGQTPTTPTPTSVTVTPASPVVIVGSSSQETGTLIYSDGSTSPGVVGFWNSATPSVATVSNTGNVTGVAPGTSVISMNSGSYLTAGNLAEAHAGAGPFTTKTLPAFAASDVAGNRILCAVMWGSATGSVSSITDTAGNAYSAIPGTLEQANSNSAQWWTATGIPAAAGNAITVTWSGGGVAFPDAICFEVRGDTGVDQAAVGTETGGTSVNTTAITPAQASETIFSAVITANFVKAVNTGAFCIIAGGSGQSSLNGSPCTVSGAGSSVFQQGTFSTGAVTPTATLNAAANAVISSVALKTLTGTTTATVNNTVTTFSLSSQPTTYPYIAGGSGGTAGTKGASGFPSIYNVDLQSFYGSQSALFSHCQGNTSNCAAGDAIASFWFRGQGGCSGNGCGLLNIQAGNNTGNNGQSEPVYYAQATDPLWQLNSTTCPGTPGLSVTFHAPNGIQFSGSAGDNHLGIYDNPDNLMIDLYAFGKGAGFSIGSSTCFTGQSCTPKAIPNISSCAVARIGTDTDYSPGTYTVTSPGNYTLGNSVNAGEFAAGDMLYQRELANHSIPHAIQVSTPCVANTGAGVFPSTSGLTKCATVTANTPKAGMWFILDYTDSQINGTSLPGWQKAALKAASHYPMVITQTSGGTTNAFGFGFADSGALEGQTAYFQQGVPDTYIQTIVNEGGWSQGSNNATNGTGSAVGLIFANMPLLTCTGAWCGTDSTGRACSTTACDPTGHIHLLDSCVAKKLAGQSGGC